MEKLRQALKTLSEAEKQLRMSNDRLTWLTAALLQLAPDQQYNLPSSSADTSFNQSPLALNYANGNVSNMPRRSNAEHTDVPNNAAGMATNSRMDNLQAGYYGDTYNNATMKGRTSLDIKGHSGLGMIPQQTFGVSGHNNIVKSRQFPAKFNKEIEEMWLEVLDKIHSNSIREFLYQEGRLVGVSFGAGTNSNLHRLLTCAVNVPFVLPKFVLSFSMKHLLKIVLYLGILYCSLGLDMQVELKKYLTYYSCIYFSLLY